MGPLQREMNTHPNDLVADLGVDQWAAIEHRTGEDAELVLIGGNAHLQESEISFNSMNTHTLLVNSRPRVGSDIRHPTYAKLFMLAMWQA